MSKIKEVSVIIPTLNEAENIVPLLSKLVPYISSCDIPFEIIFADDTLDDSVRGSVFEFKDNRIGCVFCNNKGLGAAVRYASSFAKYSNVLVMDADLSHSPIYTIALLRYYFSLHYRLVIGSRYVKGGGIIGWPFSRRIISSISNFLSYPITGLKDSMSGFFVTERELLLKTKENGYKIMMEIASTLPDSDKHEVPITFKDRERGKSKATWREGYRFARELMRLYKEGFGI